MSPETFGIVRAMRVRHRRVADHTIVALADEVDLAAVPALHQALRRAIDTAGGAVVVELDGVIVLDDAALGVIVGAAARARRAGVPFSIVCTETHLVERLGDTRVDQIVPVVDRIVGG